MLSELNQNDRMRLMKFICSFAWADLEVQDEERQFIGRLVGMLDLDDEERKKVDGWLQVPPRPEEVDPGQIPKAHRELFLGTIRAVVAADNVVAPDERENLDLLEQLLA